MSKKVRIGVIGCGGIAQQAHLPGYAACQDAEIVAVCDVDEARARAVAEKFSVKDIYTSHTKLLADSSIEAVSICTPNYLHSVQTIDALKANKHVLTEKPMATNREDARAMLEAWEQSGKLLMVGFTHRFDRANRYMRKLIDSGEIGRVVSIRVRMAHHGPYDSWVAKTDWFFRHEMAGGGAVLDMGIHALDIMRYLNGDMVEVKGLTATNVQPIKDEDMAMVITRFENGALGSIETGWHSWPGGFGGIEVYGTEGTMVHQYGPGLTVWDAEGTERPVPKEALEGVGGHMLEMRHFVDCVKNGVNPEVDGVDGYKAVELALLIYGR